LSIRIHLQSIHVSHRHASLVHGHLHGWGWKTAAGSQGVRSGWAVDVTVDRACYGVLRAGIVKCRLVRWSGRRERSGVHLWRGLGRLGARAVSLEAPRRAGREPTGSEELGKLGVDVGLSLEVPLEIGKPVVGCGSRAEGCNGIGLEAGHAGENVVVAEQCRVPGGQVIFLLVHFLV
jgi:hypothetical protein